MKRSKAKKKKAVKKAVTKKKVKAKKKAPRVARKPKSNIAARAKMAGVLCISGEKRLIVKRLTKEVQDAVDAGVITAISLKGPKLILAGGALAAIKEGRFEELVKPIPRAIPEKVVGAVAASHDEDEQPAPAKSTIHDLDAFNSPQAQAAQGATAGA